MDDQGTTVHTWPRTFSVGNSLYLEDADFTVFKSVSNAQNAVFTM